jgi:tRNA-2-methylthio-N6-dimethylallyladenosine synthase
MNRTYSREWYMDKIKAIKRFMPDCAISTDVIAGFCSETEDEHQDTLSLMEWVGYDFAFMFKYSERPKTLAERRYKDDIPEEIKNKRLTEIVNLQQALSAKKTHAALGKIHRVLIEGVSKKSAEQLFGRNTQNTVVVFDKGDLNRGDYVDVMVERCTSTTLIGKVIKVVNRR